MEGLTMSKEIKVKRTVLEEWCNLLKNLIIYKKIPVGYDENNRTIKKVVEGIEWAINTEPGKRSYACQECGFVARGSPSDSTEMVAHHKAAGSGHNFWDWTNEEMEKLE